MCDIQGNEKVRDLTVIFAALLLLIKFLNRHEVRFQFESKRSPLRAVAVVRWRAAGRAVGGKGGQQ
jgi:hypothetical protein